MHLVKWKPYLFTHNVFMVQRGVDNTLEPNVSFSIEGWKLCLFYATNDSKVINNPIYQ